VSIRRLGDGWIATVFAGDWCRFAWHKYPTRALVLALRSAEALKIDGIDLSMGCAYEHPWGALSPMATAV
jgi:hypothetical protein